MFRVLLSGVLLYFSAPVNPLWGAPIEILERQRPKELLLKDPEGELLFKDPEEELLLKDPSKELLLKDPEEELLRRPWAAFIQPPGPLYLVNSPKKDLKTP